MIRPNAFLVSQHVMSRGNAVSRLRASPVGNTGNSKIVSYKRPIGAGIKQ